MFGLTIEKLLLVALIAAVIIGPRRLPEYAGRLGALVRRVTLLAGDAARRVESEIGVENIREDWTALDPRQYDPRRIIRDAWAAGEIPERSERRSIDPRADGPTADEATAGDPTADVVDDARTEAAGAWIVAGSSGHPRRVWVPADS